LHWPDGNEVQFSLKMNIDRSARWHSLCCEAPGDCNDHWNGMLVISSNSCRDQRSISNQQMTVHSNNSNEWYGDV